MKKLTLEEYTFRFRQIYGNRYTPLNYGGDKNPIDIRCNTCNKIIHKKDSGKLIYSQTTAYICRHCDTLYRHKLNFERLKHEILDDSFDFIEDFIDNTIPIKIIHHACGSTYKVKPINFLNNFKNRNTSFCKECSPAKNRTTETYAKELFEKSNGMFELISEYTNAQDPIVVRHKNCGRDIYVSNADNMIRRLRCPICDSNRGTHRQKTLQQLISKFNQRPDASDYKLIYNEIDESQKISSTMSITIYHNECKKSKEISPYTLAEYTCTECNHKHRVQYHFEQFKAEFEECAKGEYILGDSVEYENNKTLMEITHTKCGNVFYQSRNHFISNNCRCPHCSSSKSKGEQTIHDVLNNHEYSYLPGNRNPDCISLSGKSLEIDVQVTDSEGNVIAWIEYDGEQHFNPNKCFGQHYKKWEGITINDNIRNKYTRDHNIPFLRIPFTITSYEEIETLVIDFLLRGSIPDYILSFYRKYEFSSYGER